MTRHGPATARAFLRLLCAERVLSGCVKHFDALFFLCCKEDVAFRGSKLVFVFRWLHSYETVTWKNDAHSTSKSKWITDTKKIVCSGSVLLSAIAGIIDQKTL